MECAIYNNDMVNKEKITATSALKIIGYIREYYNAVGLGNIGHIQLHVLSDEEMTARFDWNVEGNACSDHTINVRRNVRPSQFAEIFAHELLHIWQFEHGMFQIDPLVCEGFCNLGAYLFLQHVGTPGCREGMERLMTDPDPIYGEGFRLMLGVYQRSGWEGAIQVLRNLQD